MSGSSSAYIFSGHESFPFRYPWLKKGFDAICDDPSVFTRDDALKLRELKQWGDFNAKRDYDQRFRYCPGCGF